MQAHDPGSVVKYRNMKVRILPDNTAPPAGLVPIADAELDQLVSQASNDNIPLIDLHLAPPASGADAFWSDARRLGLTPASAWPEEVLADHHGSLLVIVDRDKAPDVALLQAAKAAGVKVAFSAGGVTAHRRGATQAAAAGHQGRGPGLEGLLGAGQALNVTKP